MELLIAYGFASVVVLLTWLALRRHVRIRKLPPGPTGLPIIGNTLQVNRHRPDFTFTEWAEKYGDVYTIDFFGDPIVVLNSYEAIYEALVSKSSDFAGRMQSYRLRVLNSHADSSTDVIGQGLTPSFVCMKKVMTKYLKLYEIGGLKRLERLSLESVKELVEDFDAKKGQPFDARFDIHVSIMNIMTTLLFGKKYDVGDPKFLKILEMDQLVVKHIGPGKGAELDLFPWLSFFPNETYQGLLRINEIRDGFWNKELDEAKACLDKDDIKGVLDSLLLAQTQEMDADGNPILMDANIRGGALNFLVGATVTTTTTLYSMLHILLSHKEVQKNLQKEIDEIIGQSRVPTLKDRSQMPYMEAFILENLRYASIFPILFPHAATRDSSILGHHIPKGTTIFCNAWNLHHNEKYWKDPWKFSPERFLDENGCLLSSQHEHRKKLLAFGAGRRVCMGEAMAKNRLFLYMSVLLQHFTFEPEGEGTTAGDPRDYALGVVISPKDYRLRAVARAH